MSFFFAPNKANEMARFLGEANAESVSQSWEEVEMPHRMCLKFVQTNFSLKKNMWKN